MKPTEQTFKQLERVVRKISDKFPETEEPTVLTDIHLRVTQDTGEIVACDDDGVEITRGIVEQWIGNTDDDFIDDVVTTLHKVLAGRKEQIENMSILKPYAFVFENDENDEQQELYVVDGDTVIIDPALMEDMEEDLNRFFERLMSDTNIFASEAPSS